MHVCLVRPVGVRLELERAVLDVEVVGEALAQLVEDPAVDVLTVRQRSHLSKGTWTVGAEEATYRAADGGTCTARLHGYSQGDPLAPLPRTVFLSADGRDGLLDSDYYDALDHTYDGFYRGADITAAVLALVAGSAVLRGLFWLAGQYFTRTT